MTKAHDIQNSLTNDQIIYLYAAENLWSSFDYFPQEELEMIGKSGVDMDSCNLLHDIKVRKPAKRLPPLVRV